MLSNTAANPQRTNNNEANKKSSASTVAELYDCLPRSRGGTEATVKVKNTHVQYLLRLQKVEAVLDIIPNTHHDNDDDSANRANLSILCRKF